MDEEIYVRIAPRSVTSSAAKYAGTVGKAISSGEMREGMVIVFVDLAGNGDETSVFNEYDLEVITKREYFKGALGG